MARAAWRFTRASPNANLDNPWCSWGIDDVCAYLERLTLIESAAVDYVKVRRGLDCGLNQPLRGPKTKIKLPGVLFHHPALICEVPWVLGALNNKFRINCGRSVD